MKIFVTGIRGIPYIPGGIETHCQELYPRISSKGHEVLLATRSPYVLQKIDSWKGVKLIHCYACKIKSLEAIVHTFNALVKARFYSPDIVHIHAIGPSLLVPFARLMGLKVVVTSQGPDYDRQKWGKIAKFALRLGEKMASLYANEVIVVSSVIAEIMSKRYQRTTKLIYNGVTLPKKSIQSDYLARIAIKPNKYILAVSRIVPEKGLHDLVNAFKLMICGYKLVIAGDADHETKYSKDLRRSAEADNRIILTGYITGESLNQVFSHARLFVLPSYHEGLPLAMLEALSYGIPVLVSDIPANKEAGLSEDSYFKCGDVIDLKNKVETLLSKAMSESEKEEIRKRLQKKFNWDVIADQTIDVYEKVLNS